MIEWLYDPAIWASLITLTAMEIVLGIDNVVFISVVVARLPKARAMLARQIGLFLALFFRIALLLAISWIISLKEPVFTLFDNGFSWRDIILIAGGLFLLVKSTLEIHHDMEAIEDEGANKKQIGFFAVVAQVIVIDIVFSVDSIITAIGMAEHVEIMITAVVISMIVMYFASVAISEFIEKHPTTKMLALSFLLIIGIALIADGLDFHIPRGYLYFAMAFSALVEIINIQARKRRHEARAKALQRRDEE